MRQGTMHGWLRIGDHQYRPQQDNGIAEEHRQEQEDGDAPKDGAAALIAVISNLKRGYELFRVRMEKRARFDANGILERDLFYNIRLMTERSLRRMQIQMQ